MYDINKNDSHTINISRVRVMNESITRKRKSMRKSEKILEVSLELFCERGLEETTIEEIAKSAGVGTATIYRYFSTKAELAISSAIFYWRKISEKYVDKLETPIYFNLVGKKQMEQILELFVELYEKEFLFWKFLYEFDAFVRKQQISWERLEEYEACILNLKPYVTKALEKGLEDESLHFFYSVDEVYFTLMHLMISLIQKLAVGGRLLPSDERVASSLQIKIAGDVLIQGLAAFQENSEK